MPIWKLDPVDLSDPSWQASSHHGPTLVRAPDEDAAREAAQEAFGVKTRFPPGEGLKAPPWKRPELVTAELVTEGEPEPEGPTEILAPTFETDLPAEPPKR